MAEPKAVSKMEPAEKFNEMSEAESDVTLEFGKAENQPQPVPREDLSEEESEEKKVDDDNDESEADAEASDNCCTAFHFIQCYITYT